MDGYATSIFSPNDLHMTTNLLWNDWSPFAAMGYSADGLQLASGSMDGKVRIWDLSSQTVIQEFTAGDWGIANVVFSPDGDTLVTYNWYSEIIPNQAWRVVDGAVLFQITGAWIISSCFSPDGSMLFSLDFQVDEKNRFLVDSCL
jgi:WD40 repeat protein